MTKGKSEREQMRKGLEQWFEKKDEQRLAFYHQGAFQEVPGFVPRRNELCQLVAYWVRSTLLTDFWMLFVYQTSGIEDIDHVYWAEARVGAIMKFLGEKETKEIIERTKQEYRESLPPEYREYWDIFLHGTREERKAAQQEIEKKVAFGNLRDLGTSISRRANQIEKLHESEQLYGPERVKLLHYYIDRTFQDKLMTMPKDVHETLERLFDPYGDTSPEELELLNADDCFIWGGSFLEWWKKTYPDTTEEVMEQLQELANTIDEINQADEEKGIGTEKRPQITVTVK